ncbi:MAG TPA: glutathione S-transferase [Polyangiaceae bacterium]|nr:glutathione S-transferase [Polyangiaceae bacterium]
MLKLVGANLNYSSWTIRPWLALTHWGIEFGFHDVGLKTRPDWRERILSFSGAGKVPILIDGALSIHESLAICEYLSELHPAAKLWPGDPQLRARGRAISCEMLSSFQALRSAMNCNLRGRAKQTPRSAAIDADVRRVLEIWDASLQSSGGPFLFGEFSIADCMYFPVATRFRTYGVELPEFARGYSRALFELPAVQKLEQIASAAVPIPEYDVALG